MNWSRLDSLTIRQLQVFCTVARHLSYTRAAEELGCQQPTVSAVVAELERVTHLTLLEQWGKRLALTDEGRELYTHAKRVVTAADEAWQAMAELKGVAMAHALPLRIAADTMVGTYVLPHFLAAFERRRNRYAGIVLFGQQLANQHRIYRRPPSAQQLLGDVGTTDV